MPIPTQWELVCLLCGRDETDPQIADAGKRLGALVAMQVHAMEAHGLTPEDFAGAAREEIVPGEFIRWRLLDGREWLEADVPMEPEDLRPMLIPELARPQICGLCRQADATHVLFDRRAGRERKGSTMLCARCLTNALGVELPDPSK